MTRDHFITEKAFEKMTPDQRKKNVDAISEMMGMPVKKNNSVYKKDQVKCPYCGSKNTAQILYDYPPYWPELKRLFQTLIKSTKREVQL